MKGIFYILLSLITTMVWAQNSVLHAGQWHKIGVTQNGIYKIDYDFLQKAGISINNIDPRHIRLYGNGGGMLPQPNDAPRPVDLQENTLFIQGEGDGSFDTQDYILFYGQSPDKLFLDSVGTPRYQKHLYSDTTYYFLTIAEVPGQRIETQENVSGNYPLITTFDELIAHELDEEKVIISGREWYGERFASGQTQNFTFERPGIQENTDIDIVVNVLNRAVGEASFEVALNGTSLGNIPLEAVSEGTYSRKGKEGQKLFAANSNALGGSPNLNVNLRFGGGTGSAGSIGHLNRMLIKAQRRLSLYGAQTIFRSSGSLNHSFSTFELKSTATSIIIWDITNPIAPKNQTFVSENESVKFSVATQELREFIAFQNSDFLQPVFVQPVPNQNLHGTSVPEMLIITHASLRSEAERLAAFRTQQDGLEVAVVNVAQIFNEFSSGAPDVTAIRDFVKYLYEQNPEKLKYLLLFGKGTYDFKNKVDGNINLIPTYESYNSLDPVYSFSSDDYFGLLEVEEGAWAESLEGESTLEIGIGRLPVKNVQEARAVVNKLIRYDSAPEGLGKWRNTVFFVADDGDGDRHQKDADFLARFVDTAYTTFNVNKIYLDAFPQQSQASGEIAPLVNQQIEEAIEKGALIMNYIGHGGEVGWAEERILNLEMINRLKNKYNLPFFVTATCEFGRHDDPRRVSGAEQLVLHENGGAIGLVTTARPVFSSTNFKLNSAFYQKVFTKENGQYPTLGEIFRYTKNENKVDRVNRNFSLLGDPSMRLAYAKSAIVIDSVEDITAGAKTDTLKALSKIEITGHVSGLENEDIDVNFNGTLEVVMYDKPETVKTLGNAGTTMQFEQRSRIIHRGQASVKSGKFTISFVVPKNINYQKDFGKLSLYAWEGAKENLLDASGATTSLIIGGSNKNIIPDNNPPVIELFMDDTSFVSGAVIGNNTRLLARFTDENGINVSQSSLGQNIVATLKYENSEMVQTIILNDFYITDLDTYASGKVIYPLSDLKEGNYILEVKAWDTYNNAGNASIAFTVVSENSLKISEFINYPNPVKVQTTFLVSHNRAGDDLAVSISIYNIQGEIINTFNTEYMNADARLDDMVWYGTNATGHSLPPGIYLARVLVKSLQDGTKNEKYRKLIIIN